MNNPIKHTHQGVDITYDESRNVWVYELRGRERSSESLSKAKEIIDKPEPKEKQPFERVTCWYSKYGQDILTVEATSVAETPSWSSTEQIWIRYLEGRTKRREKVSVNSVFPQSPDNNELVAKCKELASQIEQLNEQLSKTKSKLKPLTLPNRG